MSSLRCLPWITSLFPSQSSVTFPGAAGPVSSPALPGAHLAGLSEMALPAPLHLAYILHISYCIERKWCRQLLSLLPSQACFCVLVYRVRLLFHLLWAIGLQLPRVDGGAFPTTADKCGRTGAHPWEVEMWVWNPSSCGRRWIELFCFLCLLCPEDLSVLEREKKAKSLS